MTILDLDYSLSYKIKASKFSKLIWTSRIALYTATLWPMWQHNFSCDRRNPKDKFISLQNHHFSHETVVHIFLREKLRLTRCIIFHSMYNELTSMVFEHCTHVAYVNTSHPVKVSCNLLFCYLPSKVSHFSNHKWNTFGKKLAEGVIFKYNIWEITAG